MNKTSRVFLSGLWKRYFHKGRGGRAKLAIAGSLASRLALIAVSLVSVPITIGYLGNEGYGLMLTLTSVIGWLQFSSLGIGLGLQNALTEEVARNDLPAQSELVSTALFSLTMVVCALLSLGIMVSSFVDWPRIFPLSTSRFVPELRLAVAFVFGCFCVNVVLTAIQAIFAARQELHLHYAQSAVAGFIGLGGLVLAVRFDLGLTGVIAGTVGTSVVMGTGFALWLVAFRGLPQFVPRLQFITRRAWKRLSIAGSVFLVLHLCNIALYQSDAFILTHILGPESVTPYGVAQRVYAQMATIFGTITFSLWGAYGHAKTTGDLEWILRIYRRTRRLLLLLFVGALLFMASVGPPLLRWWVGADAAPGLPLILSVGFLAGVQQWAALHAMMLNGLDVIGRQLPCAVLHALLTIVFGVIGARWNGALGFALGAGVACLVTGGWYLPWLARQAFREMEAKRADVPAMERLINS